MISQAIRINTILLNSKKDLSFLNKCVYDDYGNDFLYSSESELLENVCELCKKNKAKIINSFVNVSLPVRFPSHEHHQMYRTDIVNATNKSFKVNAMIFYIILPDSRCAIVNRIESRIDHFVLDKKDTTTLLICIEDDFSITSVKQLYKTDKARISRIGAKHPVMFAYYKMDMSSQKLSEKLSKKLMGRRNTIGYNSVSDVLKSIYSVIGNDVVPIQDIVPLDIAYAMNEKNFIISKYKPSLNPVWFNILVELGMREDMKVEVSSIMTTDRIVIPDNRPLHIHSPSDLMK